MPESYSVNAILSAQDKGFSSAFKNALSSTDSLAGKLKSGIGFGIMQAVGMKAFNALSAGVGGFMGGIIETGKSFDTAMSQVAATMQKPREELQAIADEASRLGETTKFTATEAAEGFNILAQSGLTENQQIAAMGDVLNLASAGAEDMNSAASQLTGTIKGFNSDIEGTINGIKTTQYYSDLLAKGASLANTDVTGLGNALAGTAATAHSYGQTADGTTLSLLRLAEGNVTGEAAATMLNRTIADLYAPTDQAAAVLDKLGVSAYDLNGNARDANEVCDQLAEALSGMTDEERNAAKNAIFTTNGLNGFNKIVSVSKDKVGDFKDGLGSASDGVGAAADMAAKQLDNLEGDLTIFGSATEGLQKAIYDNFSGAMRGVVQLATQGVSKLTEIVKGIDLSAIMENANKYIKAFKESFAGVGAAFGEAFGAVGKSLGKLNGKFGSAKSVDSFRDAMKGVADALKGLAKFIESHSDQIAWLITQLPKLAAAFIGFKILKTLTGPLFTFGRGIASIASAIGGGLAGKLKKTGEAGELVSRTTSSTSGKMLEGAKAFALMGVGVLLVAVGFALLAQSSIALSEAGPAAIGVMVGMVGALAALGAGMVTALKALAPMSSSLVPAAASMLLMGAAVLVVAAGFAILAQSAIALASAGPTAIAVMAGMVVALAGLGAGMVIALQALAPLGPALIPAAAAMLIMGAAVLVVAVGFTLLANTAINLANAGGVAIGVMAGLVLALAGLMVLAAVLGPALTAGALGLLAFGAAMLMVGAGARLAAPLVEALPPVITAIGDAMSQVIPVIADAVTQITTAIGDTLCKAFETAAQSISTVLDTLGQTFQTAGETISTVLETLSTGISTVVTSIGDAISGVLDSIAGIITSVGEAAKNAGIGFYLLAEGVRTLTQLNIVDMGTSLAAVAAGVAKIAAVSAGLAAAGEGMKALGTGLALIQAYAAAAVAALQGIPAAATPLSAAAAAIVPAFAMMSAAVQSFASASLMAFASVAGGAGGVIAAFTAVGSAVRTLAASAGAASGGIGSLAGALSTTANGARTLASGANAAQSALRGLTGATNTVQSGISKLGAVAVQSMNQLTNAFRQAAAQAATSGRQIGTNLLNGVKSGLNKLPGAATAAMSRFTGAVRSGGARAVGAARSAASSIVAALRSASSGAHSAGVNIGAGLAGGMASQLGRVRSIAAQLAAAANAAIRAKAQIHSPSKVTQKSGAYMGQGLANGLRSKTNEVRSAASMLAGKAVKALSKGTSASKGGYKKLAEKLGKTYKNNLSKVVKKNLKSAKKLIGDTLLGKSMKGITKTVKKKGKKAVKALKLTEQGKKLSKELYAAYKDAMKKASDKAVTATEKTLTRLGEKYQKKYDDIISKRKAFYERLSDVGDLYTADDYGYVALKDFKSMTKQIRQYSKNIEKLKQILPKGLMEEILSLDTDSGLQLTNHLLGMSTRQIEKWGKQYKAMVKAAKKTSRTFYQPQLDAVKQAFDLAVGKQMQGLDRKLDKIGQSAIQGFINGMNKKMKSLKGNSRKVAKSVVNVLKSELQIHSPSRVMAALGQYAGQGFVNGLDNMTARAEDAMRNLVTLPDVQVPDIRVPALAGPGGADSEINLGDREIVIVVPVDLDGREIARATAKYDAEEQAKLQRRDSRRRGRT